jgi:hypothetical protein
MLSKLPKQVQSGLFEAPLSRQLNLKEDQVTNSLDEEKRALLA